MVSRPGYELDFDRIVADSINNSKPNTLLYDDTYFGLVPILELVAINGRVDLVQILLEAGAMINANELSSVVYWGCSAEMLNCLLEHHVPHDIQSLRHALRNEHWDILEILLDYGTDVNTIISGACLLHVAAWQGEQTFLESLLRRGADVHARDADVLTPLMKACDYVRSDHKATPRIVETLLQHGSDPHAITPKGETPLLLCVAQQLPDNPERTEIARVLLRYGAEPNWPSQNGTTPLMLAARDNNLPLATALVEANASPQLKTPDGRTARDIAMQYKAHDVLAFLQSLPE